MFWSGLSTNGLPWLSERYRTDHGEHQCSVGRYMQYDYGSLVTQDLVATVSPETAATEILINAHQHDISCICMNQQGTMIATCSSKVYTEALVTGILPYTCTQKFSPIFATHSHWQKFYHVNFLSCIKDCIEDMATFTILAKFFFCNTKVPGLDGSQITIFIRIEAAPQLVAALEQQLHVCANTIKGCGHNHEPCTITYFSIIHVHLDYSKISLEKRVCRVHVTNTIGNRYHSKLIKATLDQQPHSSNAEISNSRGQYSNKYGMCILQCPDIICQSLLL